MMLNIKNLIDYDGTEHIVISFVLHVVILLLLATVTIIEPSSNQNLVIISSLSEKDDIINNEMIIEDIENFSEDISVIEKSSQAETNAIPMPENLAPIQIESEINIQNNIPQNFNIETKTLTETVYSTVGDSISQQQNIGGVVDRLTSEIVGLAQHKDTNIIWLFDASISLSNQRMQIKNRISKILKEIDDANFSTKNILHTVCSFGESLNIISKEPTNDAQTISKDIESISLDTSGIENIFSSIINLCDKYKNYRNAIIVFTDEIGDDPLNLEKCISIVNKKGTPIYVVGPPAPFGSSKIQFKYVDPDPKFDQRERWVEIQQGPETLFKMTLDLHTLPIDEEGLDSGYGPYALTRLCNNSGGIYFAIHPNRSTELVSKKQIAPLSSNISRFFDSSIMSKYKPDYRNIMTQQNDAYNNQVKLALTKACQIPLKIIFNQKMNFTIFSEAAFAEQLKEAQNFSAKLEPQIDQIYNLLKDVESYANNLKEDRWIASYYLAMGRISATKCRIELYNLILAEAKSGLIKKDSKSNAWELSYNSQVQTENSQLKKMYDLAQKYLKLVIEKYPETPWAVIAQEELNTPMGYKWTEKYIEPPKPNTGNNNNNNIRQDDMKKKLEYKPQRKIDKI